MFAIMVFALLVLSARLLAIPDAPAAKGAPADPPHECDCTRSIPFSQDESRLLLSPLLRSQKKLQATWGRRVERRIGVEPKAAGTEPAFIATGVGFAALKPDPAPFDMGTGCGDEVPGTAYTLPESAGPCDLVLLGIPPKGLSLTWHPPDTATDHFGWMAREAHVFRGKTPFGVVHIVGKNTCTPAQSDPRTADVPALVVRAMLTRQDGTEVELMSRKYRCSDDDTNETIDAYLGAFTLKRGTAREIWLVFRVGGWEWGGVQIVRLGEDGQLVKGSTQLFVAGGC